MRPNGSAIAMVPLSPFPVAWFIFKVSEWEKHLLPWPAPQLCTSSPTVALSLLRVSEGATGPLIGRASTSNLSWGVWGVPEWKKRRLSCLSLSLSLT